jgi:hypothetical protein
MTCAIIAHEQKALEKIFTIVKRAFDNLPKEIRPITNADNVNELKFEYRYDGLKLDSSIYVALKVRSGTVQNLHITEIAYIKNVQELNAGSKQAVPKTGRITEETTANGFNHFYDNFMESYQNENPGDMEYKAYFYSWFENSDYTLPGTIEEYSATELQLKKLYNLSDGQLLWRRWKIKELQNKMEGIGLTGEQQFKQEYPSSILEAFQSGAGNVFDTEKLEAQTPKPPLSWNEIHNLVLARQLQPDIQKDFLDRIRKLYDLGVWFWHLPTTGVDYVSGVDPSDGNGSDYGPIDIWTKKPNPEGKRLQCAQFYGKALPNELAEIAKLLCELYNKAFVGVENNMLSTILFLSQIYDNYYFESRMDERTMKRTKKIGWNTNISTRDKMLDDLLIHHTDDLLEVNSKVTQSEMKTFVRKMRPNGSYKREHADGKHDDCLFAAGIALQMALYEMPTSRLFAKKPAGF